MLVTFREHAAPDLCIFHTNVTIDPGRLRAADLRESDGVSGLFTVQ
jgi:hypothetical protein